MSEGWDPCPDWIVTCGGRVEMEEGRGSHLPPHPPSQRAVTSLRDGSVHSLTFSAPLSLSPSLPFSLHKRLPATYWGSSPLLVWKVKDQQEALDSSWVKFMRNQPRFLPSKSSHSRDACVTRDIRIRPEIRREAAEVLKTPRTWVGRGSALERRGAAPVWGLQGIRAGQRGQPMSVGTVVFVRVDAGKDMHRSLHGNSDHSRLWNPGWLTSSGRKAPTPVPPWGSAKLLETNKGPRHSNHNARISVLTSHALNGPLSSYSDSWDFLRPQKPTSYRGEGVENKILLWAGQECLIRYEALGKLHNLYKPISSPVNKGLSPTPSTCYEKWVAVLQHSVICHIYYK